MIFEQHYLNCLSQASYLIGDEKTGRAVVVDPRRDVALYNEAASLHGLTIEMVLETHFHADFLSGHLELAAQGASIAYGSVAETGFDSQKLDDGEWVELGDVSLQILHTPGHTPESISIAVYETPEDRTAGTPYAVLTGDTLFIGDVGRPDLLSSQNITSTELGGMLYDSLHQKLMTLPDDTRVYPAHGAGSSCGKNLSTDTWSTIGAQRESNYALADMTKEEFIAVVTDGQTAPPSYFGFDAMLNRQDRELLDEASPVAELTLAMVELEREQGAMIIDAREPADFAAGHVVGAVNIGMSGRFAEFAGGVIPPETPMMLITAPGDEMTARNRLARIGFDSVVGFIPPGVQAELASTVSSRVDVARLKELVGSVDGLQLLDVRQPGETEGGVIDGATLIPLTRLHEQMSTLDPQKPTLVYCAGGFRSMIASSLMEQAGFADVTDLLGGYGAWETSAS